MNCKLNHHRPVRVLSCLILVVGFLKFGAAIFKDRMIDVKAQKSVAVIPAKVDLNSSDNVEVSSMAQVKLNQPPRYDLRAFARSLDHFTENRKNVLFDSEKYIQKILTSDKNVADKIIKYIEDLSLLSALPEGVSVITSKPQEIIRRMAAIDMAEQIMRQKHVSEKSEEAKDLLSSIVLAEVTQNSEQVRRFIMAEKFDAIVAIGRADRELGLRLVRDTQDEKLKQILKNGLIAGLVDSGLTREKAISMVWKI